MQEIMVIVVLLFVPLDWIPNLDNQCIVRFLKCAAPVNSHIQEPLDK